jgi:hypothetical protein
MRPRHYSYTPEAAATNSISLSQAVVGAAALTQTGTYGANGFPSELAWNITITSSANISGVNLTIVYLDAQLNQQSIVVAGPNATTKDAGIYATKIISVTTSASASNILIGHTNVGFAPWKVIPSRGVSSTTGASIGIDGTANITLQTTFANIADNAIFAGTFDVFSHSYLAALTASAFDTVDTREIGVRLKFNSWSSGAVRLDLSVSAKG